MLQLWEGLSRAARIGLVTGVSMILATLIGLSWWMLRTDYHVLFSDLRPHDAQALTSELARQKLPYRLADGGTAILVDGATVHETRLKLMGKELPLQGAVGFELFNNTDFGMTEFAQKINYQRALQGELTRTILSLGEIREARVHLAMPEQGLFKQATSRAKASITVALRQGATLRPEQVAGIQRLVAAAVPGMTTQSVTLVDSQGVALSRGGSGDSESEDGSWRLDLKRDTENHLARKASVVLERVFGAGQALASVDVTLNMDQVRVTTEDVLPGGSRGRETASGVMIKERETLRDSAAPLDMRNDSSGRGGSSQREVDYAVGRRVEQVIGQPGSIRGIHVVAVVRQALDSAQEDRVRQLVAAAVGLVPERGDSVVVQPLGAVAPAIPASVITEAPDAHPAESELHRSEAVAPMMLRGLLGLALVLVAAVLVFVVRGRRPAQQDRGSAGLSDVQRAAALERVRTWMKSGPDAFGERE